MTLYTIWLAGIAACIVIGGILYLFDEDFDGDRCSLAILLGIAWPISAPISLVSMGMVRLKSHIASRRAPPELLFSLGQTVVFHRSLGSHEETTQCIIDKVSKTDVGSVYRVRGTAEEGNVVHWFNKKGFSNAGSGFIVAPE